MSETERPPEPPEPEEVVDPSPEAESPRRLTRSRDDNGIAGVCGGLAEYLRVERRD
ncbi:MAG: PspC domain-containing protein [Gaiellaceae bacterium]